jgi:uncharacterized membrane protein
MGKKIKILISISLLLNVLLIGVVIGSISHRLFREDFPRRRPPELAIKLAPDKEKLFFDTMKRVHLENREVRKQIDEGRERVFLILSAPEFDEAAYQVEAAKLGKLHGLMMQRFAEATKEMAKRFNQEERKALAELLRRPPPPPPGEFGGPPPKPGPPPQPEDLPPRRLP